MKVLKNYTMFTECIKLKERIDMMREFEYSAREMAEKLMEFNRDFSDNEKDIEDETEYLTGVFEKLQKSDEFNILAHYLDLMFMDSVFK